MKQVAQNYYKSADLDVVGDGRNGLLENFQRVTVWSGKGTKPPASTGPGHETAHRRDRRLVCAAARRRVPATSLVGRGKAASWTRLVTELDLP